MSKKDKKKKIKENIKNMDPMYDHETNLKIADSLDNYVDTLTSLAILTGRKAKDVEEAVKVVHKNTKWLREGRPDNVFDEDAYSELVHCYDSVPILYLI